MMKKQISIMAGLVLLSGTVQAKLIASESFSADDGAKAYTHGTSIATVGPNSTVKGNFGFRESKPWIGLCTGITVMNWKDASLTHSALTGADQVGGVSIWRGDFTYDELSYRQLGAVPPDSGVYFLSGLVTAKRATLVDGEARLTGLMQRGANDSTVKTGIHYGVRRNDGVTSLAVFAGGKVFDLLALDGASAEKIYQVILKLEVSADGEDTLTAWYAADGADTMTEGLAATRIETWAKPADLGLIVFQRDAGSAMGAKEHVIFDEVRFGTELADVTMYE